MAAKLTSYLTTQRLSDVLALIQVLGLDEEYRHSEEELRDQLQGTPGSANSWTSVAAQHPEFFRVRGEAEGASDKHHRVSLLARHARPKSAAGVREIPIEFVLKLLDVAIDLHDRVVTRHDRWKYLVPIIVGMVAASATVVAAILRT